MEYEFLIIIHYHTNDTLSPTLPVNCPSMPFRSQSTRIALRQRHRRHTDTTNEHTNAHSERPRRHRGQEKRKRRTTSNDAWLAGNRYREFQRHRKLSMFMRPTRDATPSPTRAPLNCGRRAECHCSLALWRVDHIAKQQHSSKRKCPDFAPQHTHTLHNNTTPNKKNSMARVFMKQCATVQKKGFSRACWRWLVAAPHLANNVLNVAAVYI